MSKLPSQGQTTSFTATGLAQLPRAGLKSRQKALLPNCSRFNANLTRQRRIWPTTQKISISDMLHRASKADLTQPSTEQLPSQHRHTRMVRHFRVFPKRGTLESTLFNRTPTKDTMKPFLQPSAGMRNAQVPKRSQRSSGALREERMEGGVVVERHHFCFGCGVVRSKSFQRKYALLVDEPLLPNYCAKCQREVRDAESIVDVSVVNSDAWPHKSDASQYTTPSHPVQRDSEDGDGYPEREKSESKKSTDREKTVLHRRRRKNREPPKSPSAKQLRLKPISPNVGHAAPLQVSSTFLPDRRYGSLQRRAQRSSQTHDDDFVGPANAASRKTVYHKPYRLSASPGEQ
ncbi:hypothetical protein CDD83_449 [Cordyceps sp. RAO-2017]|nr:hypothetical protein CDD83_449 [Cordyceps sp. RAO-2017]